MSSHIFAGVVERVEFAGGSNTFYFCGNDPNDCHERFGDEPKTAMGQNFLYAHNFENHFHVLISSTVDRKKGTWCLDFCLL